MLSLLLLLVLVVGVISNMYFLPLQTRRFVTFLKSSYLFDRWPKYIQMIWHSGPVISSRAMRHHVRYRCGLMNKHSFAFANWTRANEFDSRLLCWRRFRANLQLKICVCSPLPTNKHPKRCLLKPILLLNRIHSVERYLLN